VRRRTLIGAAALAPLLSGLPASAAPGRYHTGRYRTSLNLYSFNLNLNSWLKGRTKPPPVDTLATISWAARAGFEGVDVTAYYIPGYENFALPSKPASEIMAYARAIRAEAEAGGVAVTGSGALNDFAAADPGARRLDLARVKFWIEVAAEMGAPVFRVFSGVVPPDLDAAGGWEAVSRARVVPLLREVAAHAAAKRVKVVLQNHGDMTATADQTIQMVQWAGHENLAIINDTGYFRQFRSTTGEGYDWYRDIAKVLPYTASFQVKRKPAGADTAGPLMDYRRLLTDLRLSSYRGFLPLERLWGRDDPDSPRNLTVLPTEAVTSFLAEVKAAIEATGQQPFHEIRVAVSGSGELGVPARRSLLLTLGLAEAAFQARSPGHAVRFLEDFGRRLDGEDVAPAVRAALSPPTARLRSSFQDVFGV
jgi:hypothetical protein